MGEVIKFSPYKNKRTWQSNPPDKAGIWLMKCMENDFKPETVKIEFLRGTFFAVGTPIGDFCIDIYHDGLTEVQWRKVS